MSFFEKSCYKTPLSNWDVSFLGLVRGHVFVVSPVTCGISIIYRTSREPPTQNKAIFNYWMLCFQLNWMSDIMLLTSFCFSSSNGLWSKIRTYPSFLKAVLAIRTARFKFFSHGLWISIHDSWISIHCPCHGPCHGERMNYGWRAMAWQPGYALPVCSSLFWNFVLIIIHTDCMN